VHSDVAREPAAMADDGCLRLRAQVMVSRHALSAVHVAGRKTSRRRRAVPPELPWRSDPRP
jgi:hypothetical protein